MTFQFNDSGSDTDLHVFVDHKFVGTAKQGKSLAINVNAGKRQVQLHGFGLVRKLEIILAEGETAVYEACSYRYSGKEGDVAFLDTPHG